MIVYAVEKVPTTDVFLSFHFKCTGCKSVTVFRVSSEIRLDWNVSSGGGVLTNRY